MPASPTAVNAATLNVNMNILYITERYCPLSSGVCELPEYCYLDEYWFEDLEYWLEEFNERHTDPICSAYPETKERETYQG